MQFASSYINKFIIHRLCHPLLTDLNKGRSGFYICSEQVEFVFLVSFRVDWSLVAWTSISRVPVLVLRIRTFESWTITEQCSSRKAIITEKKGEKKTLCTSSRSESLLSSTIDSFSQNVLSSFFASDIPNVYSWDCLTIIMPSWRDKLTWVSRTFSLFSMCFGHYTTIRRKVYLATSKMATATWFKSRQNDTQGNHFDKTTFP